MSDGEPKRIGKPHRETLPFGTVCIVAVEAIVMQGSRTREPAPCNRLGEIEPRGRLGVGINRLPGVSSLPGNGSSSASSGATLKPGRPASLRSVATMRCQSTNVRIDARTVSLAQADLTETAWGDRVSR
jgi:hypothetical protein